MFRQSTITLTSNAAPAYIKTVLEPDMINVGWKLVSSNIAANTGNVTSEIMWDVLQSPNNVNQIGKDWFIGIGWDVTTNSNIAMTIMEQWNGSGSGGGTTVGSNTCLGYPPAFNTTSTAPVANAWCNVSPTTIAFTPGSNAQGMLQGAGASGGLSPVSFTYSHSVTIDRIIFMTSNTASINSGPAYYAGTYDSFMSPVQDPYPICVVNLNNALTAAGGSAGQNPGSTTQTSVTYNTILGMSTREPMSTAAAAGVTNFSAYIGAPLNSTQWGTLNQVELYSNKFQFSRAMLFGRSFGGGNVQPAGLRGLLKDVYLTNGAANRGDTCPIVINGVSYTAIYMTNNATGGEVLGNLLNLPGFALATFLEI